jgi:hypothetical protein
MESELPPCLLGELEAGKPVSGGAPIAEEAVGQGEMEPAAGGAGGAVWSHGDTSRFAVGGRATSTAWSCSGANGLRSVSVRRVSLGPPSG